ncbi:unnamed protein product [Rotaria sp. Silwood2]|nr:unnamed protein product [Rotaria sp. Silwood2]CAF2768339.1 unnamed protein product [Rotaria sp. Silwood2]CAF3042342.1 unnamed protein product [Rotaria sp. Silwood2]CAF3166477.1 unnamed protein product [Rotaria sp. Silwood2]CAF3939408.1 unnamed protein product [Rotaria sp. Silwood2]
MATLRIFPFIGALIAIIAVVLTVIGITTNYWWSTDLNTYAGLWKRCIAGICIRTNGGRPAALAIVAMIAIGVAAILTIFSGLSRNKSDANNNLARISGILSVILLFSSGILIAISLYIYIGAKYTTGYSFTLMAIAQFLSFLAAMLVAHWMGHSFTVIT